MKRKIQNRVKQKAQRVKRDAMEGKIRPKKGLGARIAGRFRGIGLAPDEKFPELRGFSIEPPDFAE